MGSSESGSQDSGEPNAVPPEDGYKDASKTAEQLKEGGPKAALACSKCLVDGCNESFSKSATTTTVVQHVLEVHHKTLYKQNKYVCEFGCRAGHPGLYFLWRHNTGRPCKDHALYKADKAKNMGQ